MTRQIKRFSVIFAVAVVLLIFAAVFWSVKKTERDAQKFFENAKNLEVGHSSLDDVLKVVDSSHGERAGVDACVSREGNCPVLVSFRNTWLKRLHLAPMTYFGCQFGMEAYKLQRIEFEMISLRKTHDQYLSWGAFLHEGKTTRMFPNELERAPQERYFRVMLRPSSTIWGIMITPDAPAELRKLAYNFNFSCLSRFGGCLNTEEMLPVLKRKDLTWGQDPGGHEFKSQ